MKRSEWLGIVQRLRASWPHSPLPDETIAVWWEEVEDLPADQVASALRTFIREGREFAPTGGMLRKRVTELALDAPEWGRALASLERMADLPESMVAGGARTHPRSDALAASPPVIQHFVREHGWEQIRAGLYGDGSDEARLRDKWRTFVARTERDGTLVGLPAADLRALERVASKPKPIRAVIEETVGR